MSPLLAVILLGQAATATETARAYVQALAKGDLKTAASLVDGGVYSDPARRLAELVAAAKRPLFTVLDIKVEEQDDTATATLRIREMGIPGVSETVKLVRREAGWRVVPDLSFLAPGSSAPHLVSVLTAGLVHPIAMLAIVVPIETQKARAQARAADMDAMKALALALLMWSADHDDLLPRPSVPLAAALGPYMDDKVPLQRLQLKDGVRWRMNPALAGKSLVSPDHLERTVMLYEEIGGKPAARSEGGQLVALADGSVRFATPEVSKSLVWTLPKPPAAKAGKSSSTRSGRTPKA